MIPLVKLARLPRRQRLRKAEKILAALERRFVSEPGAPESGPPELAGPMEGNGAAPEPPGFLAAYLAELLRLLAGDGEFLPGDRRIFEEAALLCGAAPPCSSGGLRRALNSARHALLSAVGVYPSDWDFIDGGGRLDRTKRRVFPGMQVYLEDIRSPFNVGAMFRAAESFGVEKLWLSPHCADPRHRRALRTAMGCVDILPWERAETEGLPTGAEPCFALETGGAGIGDFAFPRRGILIAGSEELGVSPAALERADASLGRLSIKTYGAKGSLNVSVAFGIALQRWAEALAEDC
jgi:TrmH family RNA methyltransferase